MQELGVPKTSQIDNRSSEDELSKRGFPKGDPITVTKRMRRQAELKSNWISSPGVKLFTGCNFPEVIPLRGLVRP